MSRSLALAMGSSISPIPQDDFRASWKTIRTNSKLAQEKTFSSMLQLSIGDGVKAALGQAILGVLNGQACSMKQLLPRSSIGSYKQSSATAQLSLRKSLLKICS